MKKRSLNFVKEDFNNISDYEAGRDMYYFERRLRLLFSIIPKDKSIKILDFGGGSGLFSQELFKKSYESIYLADNSEIQIKQASQKCLKNVFYCDQNSLPFDNNFFDFVLILDVIEHLEDPYDTLIKISRTMKPNSLLFITYPNPYWVPLLDFLGEIGFKLRGKDNKVYYSKLINNLGDFFSCELYEGHMIASKLPKPILKFFEYVECIIPQSLKRKICLMNILLLKKWSS